MAFPAIDSKSGLVKSRPNILWIHVDDISPHTSCYGETAIETPNIDRLAREGVLFRNAFSTSPVCSPARSALITGMYQTSINAQHHRSYRYKVKNELPEFVETLPRTFQNHGYYTVLAHVQHPAKQRYFPANPKNLGKSDYNFEWDTEIYDSGGSPGLQFNDWKGWTPDNPFFAQVQLRGGKCRPKDIADSINRKSIRYPPYYPHHPILSERWADYLASLIHLDKEVGLILDQLESRGLKESTVVFFFSDHGLEHIRHKQSLYDGGIQIPLIVRWPATVTPDTRRSDPVLQIDIAASSLEAAGIPIPARMEGVPLFGANSRTREFIVAARDRSGADIDRIRCVRTERFKYIRNFHPNKPYFENSNYMYNRRMSKVMRELHEAEKLDSVQAAFIGPHRPAEELYDLQVDPYEVHNLAKSQKWRKLLADMRKILTEWICQTGDMGQHPERRDEIDENTWYHRT